MRMWNVDPWLMCRQHLLGEHVEMHMFAVSIRMRKNINGHVVRGQVDTRLIRQRHDQLVLEMKRRGYQHNSPLDYHDELQLGSVNSLENEKLLAQRCGRCRCIQEGEGIFHLPP